MPKVKTTKRGFEEHEESGDMIPPKRHDIIRMILQKWRSMNYMAIYLR